MRSRTRPVSLALLALVAGACSDTGSPSSLSQVNFNLATHAAAASTGATVVVSTPETFTDGTNTLVLTKVELVMREIELHRVGGTTDCAAGTSDDCQELEFGPVVVNLPLGTPGAARSFSVQIAPGSYDKIEFKLHAPTSSGDDDFVQANPDLQGHSVRVTGTYNGADFVYTGDFDAEMEFDLNPAIVAGETAATDLTLMVSLDGWFRDQTGALLAPASANPGQPNQALVEQNIKTSLNAFEDDDHDGRHDHGGADDGPGHQ
jgi:hypothetical protein